jgi:hypothetical protein
MGRQSPKAGFGGRTQQAGTLVAATFLPITFQRSLMPRSALDQALVTGISTSLNYGLAALIQDSVEALALRSIGTADPARVDRHGWRGGARTAAWWVATTGLSGAIVGGLQELVGRRGDVQDRSIPVAPFAGAVLVAANDYRRRRWEAHHPWSEVEEHAPVSPAKSFAMSVGVTAGLMGLAAGERQFAAGVGGLLERALPGRERLYRPVGHLAALSLLGGAVYELLRRVDRRVERGAEQVEAAYDKPPTSRLVSGGPGSAVALAELERTGAFDASC